MATYNLIRDNGVPPKTNEEKAEADAAYNRAVRYWELRGEPLKDNLYGERYTYIHNTYSDEHDGDKED